MGKKGQKREYLVVQDTDRHSIAWKVISLGTSSGQREEAFIWFKNDYFDIFIPSSTFLSK